MSLASSLAVNRLRVEANDATRLDHQLVQVLTRIPGLALAILFGSAARGQQRPDSDLDIAVQADHPLSASEKIDIVHALAESTGRPIDLIDLKVAAGPMLGQVLRHGRRLLGSDAVYGRLISRHLFEQADFQPYRNRILAHRRAAWIGT